MSKLVYKTFQQTHTKLNKNMELQKLYTNKNNILIATINDLKKELRHKLTATYEQ